MPTLKMSYLEILVIKIVILVLIIASHTSIEPTIIQIYLIVVHYYKYLNCFKIYLFSRVSYYL